jgi:hypothetical protein
MHAVFGLVKVDTAREDDARQLLNEFAIPTCKGMAGFSGGYWAREVGGDGGHSVLLFDSEENARAAAAQMAEGPPPGAPVTFVSNAVCEVIAHV